MSDPYWQKVSTLLNFNSGAVDQSSYKHSLVLHGSVSVDSVAGVLNFGATYGDLQVNNAGANEYSPGSGFTAEIILRFNGAGSNASNILSAFNGNGAGWIMSMGNGTGNLNYLSADVRGTDELPHFSTAGEPSSTMAVETSCVLFSDIANNAVYMAQIDSNNNAVVTPMTPVRGGFPLGASDGGTVLVVGAMQSSQSILNGMVRAVRFTQAERYTKDNVLQFMGLPGTYFPVGGYPAEGARLVNLANHRFKY